MILKFEEYINESLWKKGIERSKSGKTRLEDLSELEKYTRDIEWVDMGHPDVLYAKIDFPPTTNRLDDEKCLLTVEQIVSLIPNLPEGVSIMDRKQIDWLKLNCDIRGDEQYSPIQDQVRSNNIICTSNITKEEIYFHVLNKYSFMYNETNYFLKLMKDESSRYKKILRSKIGDLSKPTKLGKSSSILNYVSDNRPNFFIKLVKKK